MTDEKSDPQFKMPYQGPPDPSARATPTISAPAPVTASVAASLSKSPLGIIALFIVLVDSIACITVFALNGGSSVHALIAFIVVFPLIVFGTFTFLVIKYPNHLYGPQDFTDQRLFLLMLLGKVTQATDSFEKLAPELSDVGLPANLNAGAPLTEMRARLEQALGIPTQHTSLVPSLLPVPPKGLGIVSPTAMRNAPPRADDQDVNADDPNKGRFGGKRENASWKVEVVDNIVRSLGGDRDWFRFRLRVTAKDPKAVPNKAVLFHLHPTFPAPVEQVRLKDGIAEVALISCGSFTAGIDLPDGTQLEIDLADADIVSPQAFKDR